MLNPIVPVILGFVVFVFEIYRNMRVARVLLPEVRRVDQMSPNDRIRTLYLAGKETGQIRWYRIIALLVIYLPALGILAWDDLWAWTTVAFLGVTLLHVFIIVVARNHDQIIHLYEEKLSRVERKQLIDLIVKNELGGKR